ncbi:unnamed protein product [Musa hybrid cultivar]
MFIFSSQEQERSNLIEAIVTEWMMDRPPMGTTAEINRDLIMDNISSEKEISLEFVRESLMAISQCLPDIVASDGSPVKPAAVAADAFVDQNDGTGADDYMSKLMSISYMQSPDVKPSLPLVENPGS